MTLGGMMIVGIIRLAQRYPRGFWIGLGGVILLIPTAIGTEYLIRGGFHPRNGPPPAGDGNTATYNLNTVLPPPHVFDTPRITPMPPPMVIPHVTPPTTAKLPAYESFVARYGAEHVFRITITGVKNSVRDMATIQACFQGPISLSIGSSQDGCTCIVGSASWDMAACIQRISFGKVVASDAAAHTLTVAMNEQ